MNLLKRLLEIFTGVEYEERGKACFYCHGDLLDSDLEKHRCPKCGSFLSGNKVKGKRAKKWFEEENEIDCLH